MEIVANDAFIVTDLVGLNKITQMSGPLPMVPKDIWLYKIIPEIQLPLLKRIAELEAKLSQAVCSDNSCSTSVQRGACAKCLKLFCGTHLHDCSCCYRDKKYCHDCIIQTDYSPECPDCAEKCSRVVGCGRTD
jgi:hypothetical protein